MATNGGYLTFTGTDHTWKARVEQFSLFSKLPLHKRTIKSRGLTRVCCGCGKRDILHYTPQPFEDAFYNCRSCSRTESEWRGNARNYWTMGGGLRELVCVAKHSDYSLTNYGKCDPESWRKWLVGNGGE